ncbi:hypothetical protein ACFY7H_22500 [Streptomyces sp. NPDC012794]|uniref:bestrophin-like domain n=1 Tax=Streptomyces sp. NPDC012794 TaxID=3364850 RepID=UPI003699C217
MDHLSTFFLGVVIVGGFVALALGGSLAARRRFPHLANGEHNEMVGVTLGMFGAIYGIILAFVVALWTQLENTQNIVAGEATGLALVVRSAEAFPPAERARVERAVGDYVHAVVEVQWPLMREGEAQLRGDRRADARHVHRAASVRAGRHAQRDLLRGGRRPPQRRRRQRRARVTMAETSLPGLLQVLVYGGALVILPLTFLFGLRGLRMQLLFVSAVAGLIGFSLLLVVVLDRPFAGELSVSPAPYNEAALAQFWPHR